jgi:hypothetical protein
VRWLCNVEKSQIRRMTQFPELPKHRSDILLHDIGKQMAPYG